jgi:hypothetical protein
VCYFMLKVRVGYAAVARIAKNAKELPNKGERN